MEHEQFTKLPTRPQGVGARGGVFQSHPCESCSPFAGDMSQKKNIRSLWPQQKTGGSYQPEYPGERDRRIGGMGGVSVAI